MPQDHVQTKREIEAMLSEAGCTPRKRFGQNFLIDGNLLRRLADAAGLTPADRVLEVGGGTGGLTDLLVKRAGRVMCVEIDPGLQEILASRFRESSQFTLVRGDVLEGKHRLSAEVAEFLSVPPVCEAGHFRLVANLPYQVATPVLMNILESFPGVDRLCFTVQAEVGGRIVAQPGTKAYGPLSIVCQLLCAVETIAKLPPTVFWPRPAVDSIMLRLDVRPSPFPDLATKGAFIKLVRRTFEHRRKTLRVALGYVVDKDTVDRICSRWDGARRPESLTAEEWLGAFHTAME